MWRQPSSFHHANICVCNSVWKCRLPHRRNLCLLWFWLALLYKLGTLTHAQLLQAYLHAALWLWHLEKKKALGGNSNLASRAVHSLTSELGSADYLWPRHPWICIICCPRLPSALSIFNIGSALCLSLSVRFLHLSFTTTSSLPVFHLISGSLLQGAEASLLSAPADVSSIIILKAF